MILRELLAKFGVDYDDAGARKADKDVQSLSTGFKQLIGVVGGVALVRGFGNFLVQQVQLADAIGDTADRIGVGVEALQELRFAGQDVGLSLDGVDNALTRLVRNSAEAARGQGEAKDAFSELGVSLTDGTGNLRSFDDILTQVGDGLGGAKTDADRLRLAYKIFGREGAVFAATMKNGSAGLEEFRQKARELGGVLSVEEVDAADKADKALNSFRFAIQGVKTQIASEFIPALTRGVEKLLGWVKGTKELIRTTNILPAVLIAVGAALAAMIGGARMLAFTKAGIIFGLIALALDDIIQTAKGNDSVISRFIDSFAGLGSTKMLIENIKVGFGILVEQAKEWAQNIKAGWEILQKARKQEQEKQRKVQREGEIRDWERRKRDEENQPSWLPEWARVKVGPRPGEEEPTGETPSAWDELRTRRVAKERGMGYGPLSPATAGESAAEQAAEQTRQTAVAARGPTAPVVSNRNVTNNNNVTINAGNANAQDVGRIVDDKLRKNYVETYWGEREVAP